MAGVDDFRALARDPAFRRNFERLLYLAAQRGDADLVAERLSSGIDPNCTFARGRTRSSPTRPDEPEQPHLSPTMLPCDAAPSSGPQRWPRWSA